MTTLIAPPDAPAPEAEHRRVRRYLPLAGGLLLVAVTVIVGHVLRGRGDLPIDGQPPFHTVARTLTWSMWPAVGYAALMIVALPRLARARWRYALAGSWPAAIGWALTLAATDGVSRIWTGLTTQYEYLGGVPAMGDQPLAWLRGFTHALPAYPEHVKGHPPLPMLILWALDHVGLHGPVPEAFLLIGAGCAAVPAIAATLSVIAGTAFARRALPFLVLSPTAMFVATSMDALFLGVCAAGIALFAWAARTRRAPVAAAGGVLLGAAPYLSYALLTIGALVLAVLIARRPPGRVVLALIAGALVVPAAMTLAGFWWPDGVAATSSAWAASAGGNRPYAYFLFGDLAVLAAILGPAVFAGLGTGLAAPSKAAPAAIPASRQTSSASGQGAPGGMRGPLVQHSSGPEAGRAALESRSGDNLQNARTPTSAPLGEPRYFNYFVRRSARARANSRAVDNRRRSRLATTLATLEARTEWRRWILPAAALIAVLVLDLSGITRGEVERIWLPYAAWMTTVTGFLRPPARGWLAAQAAVVLIMQATMGSPW